ncbi:MAG: redoxin domain-containing protein [Bacteriovoracaceae bacterium]
MNNIIKIMLPALLLSFHLQAEIPKEIKAPNLLKHSMSEIQFNKAKLATVVVFLSSSCPCSNSHIEHIKALKTEFPQIDFVAVHSNVNEETKESEDYFFKINLPFEVLQDDKAQIADLLQANKTPHAFLISKEGTLLYEGGVTNSAHGEAKASKLFLKTALTEFTSGKEISMKEGRTLGCAISRVKF